MEVNRRLGDTSDSSIQIRGLSFAAAAYFAIFRKDNSNYDEI